jgi:hypothetical protein
MRLAFFLLPFGLLLLDTFHLFTSTSDLPRNVLVIALIFISFLARDLEIYHTTQ